MAQTDSTLELYRHPRDFPQDVRGLFMLAEELDLESGPDWYANLVDSVMRPPERACFYVLRRADRARAALPLMLVPRRLGHELHSLSNFYTSLYMPVLAPGAGAAELDELLRLIRQEHGGLRSLHLAPMDPEAERTKQLSAALRKAGFIQFDYSCFTNWYLRTAGSWTDYLQSREGKLRNTLRRMTSKLLGQGGDIEIVTGGPRVEQALADYQRVYKASWKSPEPFADFIPGLVHAAAERGWLRLGITRVQGQAIAAQIWLVHQGRACIFKLAYDKAFKAYSPGTLLTAKLLQHVWEVDKVGVVDYLIGDDPYKKSWMSDRRARIGILAYNRRSLLGLVGALRELLANQSRPLRQRLSPWLRPRSQPLSHPAKPAPQQDSVAKPAPACHR